MIYRFRARGEGRNAQRSLFVPGSAGVATTAGYPKSTDTDEQHKAQQKCHRVDLRIEALHWRALTWTDLGRSILPGQSSAQELHSIFLGRLPRLVRALKLRGHRRMFPCSSRM